MPHPSTSSSSTSASKPALFSQADFNWITRKRRTQLPPAGIRAIPLIACMLGLLVSFGYFMVSPGAMPLESVAGDLGAKYPMITVALIGILGGEVLGMLLYQLVAHRWEKALSVAPLQP